MSAIDECDAFISTLPPFWRLDDDKYAYKYSVNETRMNTDPFVRKALKSWDPTVYEMLRGYTKSAKIGPCLTTLRKFGEPLKDMPNDSKFRGSLERAIREARSVFSASGTLKRLSLETSFDRMELDTAAGFSYPGKKKREVFEELFDLSSYIGHQVRHGYKVYEPPCLLAMRGHLSEESVNKSRPVFIYPGEVTGLECIWGIPFYEHLMKIDGVFFGEETLRKLRRRFDEHLTDEIELTMDWPSFDAYARNYLIDIAFDIIESSFDKDVWSLYGEDVKWGLQRWDRVFKFLKHYFKNTRMMLPNGRVIRKARGVPSGSMFTQAIDSIVNWIMVKTMLYTMGMETLRLDVLGDDSNARIHIAYEKKLSVDRVVDAAWACFRVKPKPDKIRVVYPGSKQSRRFLGYTVEAGRYTRPSFEWLRLALYAERDVEDLKISAARMLAYYLIGGVHDDLFSSFFRYFKHAYPQLEGVPLQPERGMARLFKYVFRLSPQEMLKAPSLKAVKPLNALMLMGFGYKPF
jgi:hypothetical protein